MKNIPFEMGAKFEDTWVTDNRSKPNRLQTRDIILPEKHQLYLAKEKRRGKVVTIVRPFYLAKCDLQALLKTLKKKLGTGGTLKDNSLELQGDIPDVLKTQLEALHYRFKK